MEELETVSATKNQCLDTAEQLHLRTHSGRDNMDKTVQAPARPKPTLGEELGTQFHPSQGAILAIDSFWERTKQFFSKCVAHDTYINHGPMEGHTHTQEYLSSINWL